MTTSAETLHLTSQQWFEIAIQYGVPVLWSCVILILACFASSWVRRLVLTACARSEIEPTLARFFSKLTRWVILLIATTFILNRFGFETASFSVLLGAVGLAVSLAFQGTLSNFASGIMLMVFRPYKIGDFIVAAGQSGVVYEIDLFSTTLDTVDNRRTFIPNSAIFGNVITNVSFHQKRRCDIMIWLHHDADIDRTRVALADATMKVPGRLSDPPEVVLLDIAASGISWQVQVWGEAATYLQVRQATLREVKIALDQAGIPFAVNPSLESVRMRPAS